MDAARLVLTTAPDRETADRIARDLVGRSLAACATILPGARSVYRWKGAVEEADELLILLKTTAERFPDLERTLIEIHPYDVPECVALDPAHVAPAYLAWLRSETAGPSRG